MHRTRKILGFEEAAKPLHSNSVVVWMINKRLFHRNFGGGSCSLPPYPNSCPPPCSLDSGRQSPAAYLVPVPSAVTEVCPEAAPLELVSGWTSVWVGMTTLSWHWLTTVPRAVSLLSKQRESNSCQNTHCSPLKEKAFSFSCLVSSINLKLHRILRWSSCCSLLTKRFLLSWASASGAFPFISSFVWRSIFPYIVYA